MTITADQAKGMNTKSLWTEFRTRVVKMAEYMAELAVLYVELQNRGEDLNAYSNPVFRFLPAIAEGKLLPEASVKFAGNTPLLLQLSNIPVEEQKALVDDKKISVLGSDGATYPMAPSELSVNQIYQVFGDGHTRSINEQKKIKLPSTSMSPPQSEIAVPEEFDLYHSLTSAQRAQLVARGSKKGLTAAGYIVEYLVSKKIITAASATTQRRRRKIGQQQQQVASL